MANYSFGLKPIPDVENGHVFTGDNFCQVLPHTKILIGVTGLKFINCNLTNCDVPVDAVFDGCKPYHVSFCSNEHPKFVEYGLSSCVVDCSHVFSIDTITIDGMLLDVVRYYESKEVI